MKKKILAVLLALTVLVNLFPSAVFAANYDGVTDTKVTFIFTPATHKALPGEEVEYSLAISWKDIGLTGLALKLSLPDGITYVSGSGKLSQNVKSELNFDGIDWTEDSLSVRGYASVSRTEAVTSPIEIMTFKVKVPVDAESGNYEMQIEEGSIEIVDGDFDNVPNSLAEVLNTSSLQVEVISGKEAVFSFAPKTEKVTQGEEVEYSLSIGWQNFYLGGFNYTLNLPIGFTYVEGSGAVNSSAISTLGVDSLNWSDGTMTLSASSSAPVLSQKINFVEVLTFKVTVSEDATPGVYAIDSGIVSVSDGTENLSEEFIIVDNASLLTVETKIQEDVENFARFELVADKTEVMPGDEISYTFKFNWTNGFYGMIMQLELGDAFTFVSGSGAIDANARERLGLDQLEWTEKSLKFTGYGSIAGRNLTGEPIVVGTFKVKVADDTDDGKYFIDTDYTELEVVDENFEGFLPEQMEFVSPKITVSSVPATGVTLDKESITLTLATPEVQLNATVEPSEATHKNVTWTSSDEKVATVDETGLVTRVGEGTAVIKASLSKNAEIYDTCDVYVPHECNRATLEYVRQVQADCYNEGKKLHYLCSCGKIYADINATNEVIDESQLVLPALNHPISNVTKTTRTEPTHTSDGNIDYWTCSLCGDIFSDENCTVKVTDVVIPATGHDDADLISWTKTETEHQKVCSCGAVLEREEHNFIWVTDKTSTCVEEGVKHEECTVCSYSRYADTAIEKLNHTTNKTSAVAETCTEDGNIEYFTCTECGNIFADEACTQMITLEDTVIKATGHVYKAVVTAPTCTEQGFTTYTCTCGQNYVEDYVSATGHTEGDWVTTIEPTFDEKGEETKYCTVCNEILQVRDIEPIGHEAGEWVVYIEPTCENYGIRYRQCLTCKDVTIEKIPALGHTEGEWEEIKTATCTADGLKVQKCTVCGEILNEETIEAYGHTEGEWTNEIESDCTTYGVDVLRCSVCDEIIDKKYIQGSEHVLGEWITTKDATCTEDGEEEVRCTVCDYVVATKTIPSTGHTAAVDEAVAPTCTETGLTEGSHCAVCGEVIVKQETIDALGHDSGEWEIVLEPTSTEEGRREKKCTVCGEVLEYEAIPASGITISGYVTSFDDGVENSDETTIEFIQNGEVVYTTSVAGSGKQAFEIQNALSGEYTMRVSKQNHATREYTVTVDGETVIEAKIHLIGDITGDGKLSVADITLINGHIKMTSELEGYQAVCADVTNDGKISVRDVAQMNSHNKEIEYLWK